MMEAIQGYQDARSSTALSVTESCAFQAGSIDGGCCWNGLLLFVDDLPNRPHFLYGRSNSSLVSFLRIRQTFK
jgi:hypothetical protein